MDPKRTYYYKEEEAIAESLSMGEITEEEAREEQRELDRDYREDARAAANESFQREMDRW